MKKVLLIIAHDGFQPFEYGVPKKVLTDGGIEVQTASDLPGSAYSSDAREEVNIDFVLSAVKAKDFDGIFFVGGPGASEYLENEDAFRVAREAMQNGKLFGAICYSTRVLAHAEVLSGKKATGWNGDGELSGILALAEAIFVDKSVVVDGNLITAVGPKAAQEFGEAILEKLK